MKHSEAFVLLANDARSRIKEITAEEVLEKQRKGEPFHFVDVREDHEWGEGRAAGAVHIGRGILERDVEKYIADRDQCVILYCGGGFRSALAADNLQKMGYRNVWSMAGGMRLWRELGYPEEHTATCM